MRGSLFCLEGDLECFSIVCDGGSWQGEVIWSIYNQIGELIISGGAPYTGCFLEGCMDVFACNYNIEATYDDGSCEYPDENEDCENVAINEIKNNLNEKYHITDVIGRKINTINSAQIYLKYYENGQIEKNINFK